ncbi:Aste57867_13612 [Aphanomyces stellatus]|uniref:Aste57867_13612 protein n=1 Tax=Aphanomyces stellatus TaxID=120398 RepID=A0A485KYX6_9STRA|nr:hypothetical protein As57867_013562 [Aphanomyces stellatus]VFT90449.1 Aste57867_13612 [Aphanomyces stellatus]
MEGIGGGLDVRESFVETTRSLSPIPHANAGDARLHASTITLESSTGTGQDEGISLCSDREEGTSRLKEGQDSIGDANKSIQMEKRPQVDDWYTRKLEDKVRVLTTELSDVKSQLDQGSSTPQGNSSSMLNSTMSVSGTKRQRTEGENAALNRVETYRRELEAARVTESRLRQKHEMEMTEKDAELEKMKRRLKFTMAEETETQDKLRRTTAEYYESRQALQSLRLDYDAQLREKEDKVDELTERMADMEEKSKRLASEASQTISSLRARLAQATDSAPSPLGSSVVNSEVRLLRKQLQEQTIQATNAIQALQDAEETIHDAENIRAVRARVAELEEAEGKHLDELRKLRVQAKGHCVLEEKVTGLYRALESSDRRLQEALAMKGVYDDLMEEKKEWQTLFQPLFADPKSTNPIIGDATGRWVDVFAEGIPEKLAAEHPSKAVCQLFVSQQHDLETLMEERYTLEGHVKKLNAQVDTATKTNLSLQSKLALAEARVADLTTQVGDAARSDARLRAANADLVALLKSYSENNGAENTRTLVQNLELALNKAEGDIAGMQLSQKSLPSPALLEKTNGRVAFLEQSLETERTETLRLRAQLEQVERAATLLEKRLAKGDVNPETTKVLHCVSNPPGSAIKQKMETVEMQQLRQENDRLKEIVQSMQTPHTPMAKMSMPTPMKSATSSHDTVEGLQKMNQRLKEVFREQIAKYRDAVYQATGYKVDLKYPDLRLRSMFAENEADEIKFQFTNNELELLETPFVASLDKRNMAYLTMCNSIPAFLSGITLALFEKQTYQAN